MKTEKTEKQEFVEFRTQQIWNQNKQINWSNAKTQAEVETRRWVEENVK